MLFLRLLARALRWRGAASFAVFVVAAVAVLSAVLGPIYLSAASQVVLTNRLESASRGSLDIGLNRNVPPVQIRSDLTADVRRIGAIASRTPWFGPTVVAESTQVRFVAPTKVNYQGRVATIDDQCAHLHFVSGSCPTGIDQIAMSARSAAEAGWKVGDVVHSSALGGYPINLTITSIYQPVRPRGSFWLPWGFFDQRPALYQGQVPFLDTFFVSTATVQSHITRVNFSVNANIALLPDSVQPGNESDVRHAVSATEAQATAFSDGQLAPIAAHSGLPDRLDAIDHELSLTRTLVDLATLQLALLAICVLYAIVSATATAHGGEVALAKLRGRSSLGILAQGLLEPVVLVLLAAPVGALLAWLAVREVAPHTLGPADVGFPINATVVTLLTALAAVGAAALAARRIVTAPVGALLRRGTETETSKTGLLVADAAALVIAVAGLVQLSYGGVLTAGKPNPLSALAPTLLAVAVAVVGLRLLPYGARAALVATRESPRLVPFLAVRQILRRANSTRLALLVSVALALATLAVATWSVGGTNRDIRALNEAGAHRVLSVTVPRGTDLREAVDQADPGGHDAMAVAILPVNSTQLLAVDTARMAGIAAWRGDYAPQSLSTIQQIIAPRLPPSLVITGTALRVDLTLTSLTKGVPLTVRVFVTQRTHIQTAIDLGVLVAGRHTYTAELPPDCAQGCRVASFAFFTRGGYQAPVDSRNPQYAPTAQLVLSDITGDTGADTPAAKSYFTDRRRWRQGGPGGTLYISDGGTGLRITAHPDVGTATWPALLPQDLPDHLPAVIGEATAKVYPGQQVHDVSTTGLDGAAIPIDARVISATIPQLGLSGTIADLTLVDRKMAAPEAPGVEHQVWLSANAPSDIEQRLTRQGLKIVGDDTAADHRAVLDKTGPAFADSVFLLAALAATILAIGGAVLAALVTARRRSYELAALEAVGVRPRVLRWASAVEQGLLIGLGVLFGVAAGIGGSALALPSTPIFVDPSHGPPLEYALPWATLLLLVLALVIVLALLCVVMARAIEGQATASRLREAAA